MWPTTSCSTKCCRKRWWTWSMIGEASGSSSRARPSISSAISRPGDAVAHQRLVHVEVEEPHLGVGDLRERLAVDAHELQEGDEREAGAEHRGDVAQQLQVVLAELVARASRPGSRPRCQIRSISAGSSPVSLARPPRACSVAVAAREAGPRCSRRRAGRTPSALADLLQRVPALAQARDDPRVGDAPRASSGRRQRHEPVVDPAAQRRRARRRAGGRPRRASARRHRPEDESGGTVGRGPAACGQCGPLPRPAAFVRRRRLAGASGPHFPAYCLVRVREVYSSAHPRVNADAFGSDDEVRVLAPRRARGSARRPAW